MTITEPDQIPNSAGSVVEAELDQPDEALMAELGIAEVSSTAGAATEPTGPDVDPPNVESVTTTGVTATQWVSNVKVKRLWADDAKHNAWAQVDGHGWRRIEPDTPSGFTNLMMLLACAAQTGANCQLQITDAKVITAAYVW